MPWRALFKALILPPAGPLLLAWLGVAIARRSARLGAVLLLSGLGSLTLLSTPLVAAWLVRAVYDGPPLQTSAVREAQAIVILGGGIRRQAAEYDGDTVNGLTLERVRYGARVARATSLPVLVTGGRHNAEDVTEAEAMKSTLEREFGIPVRWTEDRSRNTHENAEKSAVLLRADGVSRVLLVAHSFDMPRATAEFAAAGITAIPAPTGLPRNDSRSVILDFVPSASALQASYYGLYEFYANVWRRLIAR